MGINQQRVLLAGPAPCKTRSSLLCYPEVKVPLLVSSQLMPRPTPLRRLVIKGFMMWNTAIAIRSHGIPLRNLTIFLGSLTTALTLPSSGIFLVSRYILTSVPISVPSSGAGDPSCPECDPPDWVWTEAKLSPSAALEGLRLTASTWMQSVWILTEPSWRRVEETCASVDRIIVARLLPCILRKGPWRWVAFMMSLTALMTVFVTCGHRWIDVFCHSLLSWSATPQMTYLGYSCNK